MKKLIPFAGKDGRDFRGEIAAKRPAVIPSKDRRISILRRHNAGESHVDIAADYGITRERVRQIVKAEGGTPRRGVPA